MQKVRIMALGGLDEDGKNMTLIEIDQDIFIIDCGLKYPNNSEQLGIEYIIPDFSYVLEHKEQVKGVIITHGHDDVMVGLSYLLHEVDLPVYATPLTARILKREFEKHDLKHKNIEVIKRSDTFKIAGHTIHTFPVMQSIADGIGVSFETKNGQIIYASECMFDYGFNNSSFAMNISSLAHLSEKKVLALMLESVGANRLGFTSPSHRIAPRIERFFAESEERIIISLYKQNLFRIIEILDLAKKYHKRVYFVDEDNRRILKDVEELGYYHIPKDMLVSRRDFNNTLDNIVIIVSGSGNEVFRHMNRIALGDDREIELFESDQIIIASPIVPGTEKEAGNMENDLYVANHKVYKIGAKEALSMHASSEDIKMLISMFHPDYYIPVKGNYSRLLANAELANHIGYRPDRIIILDNGQFATFEDGRLASTSETIELNEMLIDGKDKLDLTGMVLRDRETLSTDGAIVLGVILNFETKELIGGPDIQSRGVIYLKDADYILEEVSKILCETIETAVKEDRYDNMKVRVEAKEKISKYIFKQTGKKPMILPAIVEINEAKH